MTANPRADLPSIPSLPPIEMPDTSHFRVSSPIAVEDQDTLSPLHNSSTSLLSQESYMTANSSLLHDSDGSHTSNGLDYFSPSTSSLLPPPSSLRKSISVDSFSKHRHLYNAASRPLRGNTIGLNIPSPAQSPFQDSFTVTTPKEISTFNGSHSAWPAHEEHLAAAHPTFAAARSRGVSISTTTTGDDEDGSLFDESDIERSDNLMTKVKGKITPRQAIPEGELTMPSRLQSVSSSPTMGRTPAPIVPERRSSLGHRLGKQRSLMSVNTHFPPLSHHHPEITIAVVGAAGCGKSSVIRKGLKAYGLSEAATLSVRRSSGHGSNPFQYSFRLGRIPCDQNLERILRVLEVDISMLDFSEDRPSSVCPEGVPSVDGVVICYDASRSKSFTHVEDFLRSFGHLNLPTIALACKSDLQSEIDPSYANEILRDHDVGLIEVSTRDQKAKKSARNGFELLFQIILSPNLRYDGSGRNPVSPSIFTSSSRAPWDVPRTGSATPTASSTVSMQAVQSSALSQAQSSLQIRSNHPSPTTAESTHSPPTPTSPTRARSMSDLLSHESTRRDHREHWDPDQDSRNPLFPMNGTHSGSSLHPPLSEGVSRAEEVNGSSRENVSREIRAPPWVSLDDLLDKLLFLAVSDDDPIFIAHFLLTYRRFATPRNILLAMQKRMRALDQPTGDPMFACFAQMKICCLLDHWIQLFPDDFAVPGTSGALSALIKSVVGKTYLLHYGSELIPFTEMLPTLHDKDASWAMKVEDPKDDSDDSSSMAEAPILTPDSPISSHTSHSLLDADSSSRGLSQVTQGLIGRERKSSLPLSARAFALVNSSPPYFSSDGHPSSRAILSKLRDTAKALNDLDPADIAREITRVEATHFLKIKPRHWLQHVLGKKDAESDPITKYNQISNRLALWVVSIILCHDKPRTRARQIEKFTDVANRLRQMNNYSALRGIVAGINSATFEGDLSIEYFRTKSADLWKQFQSFEQLLQAIRSHQKYRMALRNTKGACIPALEIHLSDLIRAHEGNPDFHDDDPNKIHWAKFNMMGRFIDAIVQCQKACRDTGSFNYAENLDVNKCLLLDPKEDVYMMDEELQRQRTSPIDPDALDEPRPGFPRTSTRDSPPTSHTGGNITVIRKLIFWS